MIKKKLIAISFIIAMLSGCASVTQWTATGGSRADATIKLSHEYGAYIDVKVSEGQAIELAQQRCRTWGYSGAEAFGGATLTCNQRGSFGTCASGIVTKEYQCTGQGNEITTKPTAKQPISYYQNTPAPQTIPQPVVEADPNYQSPSQQAVTGNSSNGKDLRYCLNLADETAIARCVQQTR